MSYEILVTVGGAAVGCAILLYASRRIFSRGRIASNPIETAPFKESQVGQASGPSSAIYESVQPQVAPAHATAQPASALTLATARRTRMYKRRAPPRRPATLRQNTQVRTPVPKADEGKSDQGA